MTMFDLDQMARWDEGLERLAQGDGRSDTCSSQHRGAPRPQQPAREREVAA
jgi:hypothetical protein